MGLEAGENHNLVERDRCGLADYCHFSDSAGCIHKSCCLGDRLVILQSKTFLSQIIVLGGGLSCGAFLFLG